MILSRSFRSWVRGNSAPPKGCLKIVHLATRRRRVIAGGTRVFCAYHRRAKPLKTAPGTGARIPRTPVGVRMFSVSIYPEWLTALAHSGLTS
jgi:hypothetical protein